MPLLLDEDYAYLDEIGLNYEEDDATRSLVLRNFPLPPGIYRSAAGPVEHADVLLQIPSNYNASGGDMFWVRPHLTKADGTPIPNANPGADPRQFRDERFERWSRHWHRLVWRPKVDNIRTLIDRVTWAFTYPNARR